MELLRLFVAIDLPRELKKNISQVQRQLAQKSKGIKWVEDVNLHLTLKFLGEVPTERRNDIHLAIKDSVQKMNSFKLQLKGLGTFGSPGKPNVIWIGIEGQREKLLNLHNRLDAKLSHLGLAGKKEGILPTLPWEGSRKVLY
ncbi:hypothetical protein N752_16220 [Desulforamulus aquiferis]|nr:RNA 2',3'-cyclic phosphodiesterase [Desulforamulus aquiferis]RYD04127.1 hypothetical protein N752_16220 [Desulforamulus aquiferis]